MRIAFVGKGGSGKTTLSSLFALYASDKGFPTLLIDADINMHAQELVGIEGKFPKELHLSHPDTARSILERLKGDNPRIKELAHFRKTTPPGSGSNLVVLADPLDPVMASFSKKKGSLSLMVVGTYDTDDIGASCYHNNLAVAENILSHTIDTDAVVVADMVAGVDAFANTLHAQFDLLILTVEPTKRGIEVFNQYRALAEVAGVYTELAVLGNKVRNDADRIYIREHIPADKLLGFLPESSYLRLKEQSGGELVLAELEPEILSTLETIFKQLSERKVESSVRLRKLWNLHRNYVSQGFIKERFGDLTEQIDESFDYATAPHHK